MEKNNIVRIIGTYLSGRFSPETEEKVQKWIIKDRDTKEKEKADNLIMKELDNITSDKVRKICQERLTMIEDGKRDFRF